MPEAPDLEIIKDYLNEKVAGQRVQSARVLRPTVLRSLAGDLADDIAGRTLDGVERQGKFLLIQFSGGRRMIINPMLTGAVQHCEPKVRVLKATCLVLHLEDRFVIVRVGGAPYVSIIGLQ